MKTEMIYLLLPAMFLVAFLYASVGHGGASGYLALMALFGMPAFETRSTALVLNIIVSALAFYQFNKKGFFKRDIFIPFVITSVPASFLFAHFPIANSLYKIILGLVLIVPVVMLLKKNHSAKEYELKKISYPVALIAGFLIGALSGSIGIGGGILLGPFLILMKWSNARDAAGISALFILLNSLSGLAGVISSGVQLSPFILPMIIMVLLGGFSGAYLAVAKFDHTVIKRILAGVLSIACVKLLMCS